jgi:hypothetical protein
LAFAFAAAFGLGLAFGFGAALALVFFGMESLPGNGAFAAWGQITACREFAQEASGAPLQASANSGCRAEARRYLWGEGL